MLRVYEVANQPALDQFISNTMNNWKGWAFVQPDHGKVNFPAKFVIVQEQRIALATIEFLH